MQAIKGVVLANTGRKPGLSNLKKLKSKAERERIENILPSHYSQEEISYLSSKGITSLASLRSFSLVDAWLAIPGVQYRYIVHAMQKSKKQFKDCDPNKENPLAEDFKSNNNWLDNLLYRSYAGSFALLRRITLEQLKDGIGKGIGPTYTALVKETLAKQGINIPD